MARTLLEQRLTDVSERLVQLRRELSVADEQLAHFADEADEARLRALVSETPLADREHREAQRHADVMNRHRVALLAQIAELEQAQDDLLDRLIADSGSSS
jgi:predicted  nucleic acid-binding Zn-ribbon protein